MKKSDFFWPTIHVPAYMELRFEAMMYSNLGNENSDAGRMFPTLV